MFRKQNLSPNHNEVEDIKEKTTTHKIIQFSQLITNRYIKSSNLVCYNYLNL